MRSVAGPAHYELYQDHDDFGAPEVVRWSRWGRSARRTWQSIDTFAARLSERNTRAWGIGFVAAWGIYGMVLGGQYRTVLDQIAAFAGFSISEVEIRGLAQSDSSPITDKLLLADHTSLLTLSAEASRAAIAALPWIDEVSVNKIYPGKLIVSLTERTPYALWQDEGKVRVVDAAGHVMTDIIEARHLGLPLVVGHGADKRAREAMDLIAASPALKHRIHAAVLVAERRWNLVTKDGVEIRLPEVGAAEALNELARLQDMRRLLDRDIEAVDMRQADRLVVKLTDGAAKVRAEAIKARTAKKKGADT